MEKMLCHERSTPVRLRTVAVRARYVRIQARSDIDSHVVWLLLPILFDLLETCARAGKGLNCKQEAKLLLCHVCLYRVQIAETD